MSAAQFQFRRQCPQCGRTLEWSETQGRDVHFDTRSQTCRGRKGDMSYECDNDNHDIGCQCPGVPSELERLHELIRRGLAYGDQFRTPYAAAARASLRESAGMNPPGRA